jgi:ring-1,2-phenylacetyl-CoA epoxidase subunit PaaC
MDALEQELADAGVAVDAAGLRAGWDRDVTATLAEATLQKPAGDMEISGGRQGIHTESLGHMLSDLQFVQRAYPGLQW